MISSSTLERARFFLPCTCLTRLFHFSSPLCAQPGWGQAGWGQAWRYGSGGGGAGAGAGEGLQGAGTGAGRLREEGLRVQGLQAVGWRCVLEQGPRVQAGCRLGAGGVTCAAPAPRLQLSRKRALTSSSPSMSSSRTWPASLSSSPKPPSDSHPRIVSLKKGSRRSSYARRLKGRRP